MSGINSGILTNAPTLSAEQIKELEKRALENNEAFAYLDENSELSFALTCGIDCIKDLAWHNAYELGTEGNTLTKKQYKKTGLKTYFLDKVLQKQNINDSWSEGGQPATERLEGDGQTFFTVLPEDLSFRSSADVNTLQEVTINGEIVDSSNYTVTEGSTIVTLHRDYLATLPTDIYSISVISEPGKASANFDINDQISYIEGDYTYTLTSDGFRTLEDARRYYKAFCAFWYTDGKVPVGADPWESVVQRFNGDEDLALDYFAQQVTLEGATQDSFVPNDNPTIMWTVVANDKTKSSYGEIRTEIYGLAVADMTKTFQNCSNLTDVPVIPSSMRYIGMSAFNGCHNLTSIVLPDSIISIDAYAFAACMGLTSIILPNSITDIGTDAFAGCSSLTSIVLPEGLKTIAKRVFYGCDELTTVTIPKSIMLIESLAFNACDKLNHINFMGTIEEWNEIQLGYLWNQDCPTITVTCIDGTVTITNTPSGPSLPGAPVLPF